MLIEQQELSLGRLGLGDLHEAALLALFADAQAHRLTAGTGVTLREITDARDRPLYPAYYRTHVRVPAARLLSSYRLWDKVEVGVDVQTFGSMLLESRYVLGRPGELSGEPAASDSPRAWLEASSMFIVDQPGGGHEVAAAAARFTAHLPALTAPPQAMARFRELRRLGRLGQGEGSPLAITDPLVLPVVPGRDAAPGRRMMFATFTALMDGAEHELLTRRIHPAFPVALAGCITTLERETYYFGNCEAGDRVRLHASGRLGACPAELARSVAREVVAAGLLELAFELYDDATNELLVLSTARRLVAIPGTQQALLRDAERLVHRHQSREGL